MHDKIKVVFEEMDGIIEMIESDSELFDKSDAIFERNLIVNRFNSFAVSTYSTIGNFRTRLIKLDSLIEELS